MSSDEKFETFGFSNFKSIGKAGLTVDKITFLTGPNSSGKSNFLEGIKILSELAKAKNPVPFPYFINQEFNYPSFDSIFYKKDTGSTISFSINVKTNKEIKEKLSILFKRNNLPLFFESKHVRSREIRYNYIGYSFSLNPLKGEGNETIYMENRILAKIELKNEKIHFTRPNFISELPISRGTSEIMPFSDFRASVNLPRNMGNYPELPDLEIVQLTFEILNDIIKFFRDKLRRVYFLSSLRGFVEPTVDASSDAEWIGKEGGDLITILSKCFASGKYNEKGNKIEHWANEFGISGLKSGFVSGGRLGSDFSDPILKTQLALSLASHGSRQILAILTQLFWSEPGDLILIEEPEISLHPEAQILLPELFADAVKDNKQIICSTHSPFLVLALPRVIQKSKISGSDIGIYEIEKTEKGTISKRKEIDERGYVKGWIETFAKVDEELFSEYLEGLEEEGA